MRAAAGRAREARPPLRPNGGPDRGSSSVLVVGVLGAVLAFTAGALALGSVVVASHHARTAADLGALAGATALRDGATPGIACGTAVSVAAANGAVLQHCSVGPGSTLMVVAARRPVLWPLPATAKARAGPASR